MKTQQKVRSERTAEKKSSATAKQQKRSNRTLTTAQIKDRTICDGNEYARNYKVDRTTIFRVFNKLTHKNIE